MTTYYIETPFFPLIVESDEEILTNVFVTHRADIERQLKAIIEKSPNPKAVDHAKRMLEEIERVNNR